MLTVAGWHAHNPAAPPLLVKLKAKSSSCGGLQPAHTAVHMIKSAASLLMQTNLSQSQWCLLLPVLMLHDGLVAL